MLVGMHHLPYATFFWNVFFSYIRFNYYQVDNNGILKEINLSTKYDYVNS